MICYMCGRQLDDNAVVCKGCGAQQKHAVVRRARLSEAMNRELTIGKSQLKGWHVCLCVFMSVAVLVTFLAVYPSVSGFVKDFISSQKEPELSPAVDASVSEIDSVSGEILVLSSKISDCVVVAEHAYDDNSWEKEFLVNGSIGIKTMRYNTSEDWINTHIFALYDDVKNVSAVSPAPSMSDCSSVRIRFTDTKYAENCTVEAVLVKSASFDHIFIVEMPNELFEEYEAWINEWIASLQLVDAQVYADGQTV